MLSRINGFTTFDHDLLFQQNLVRNNVVVGLAKKINFIA